MHCTRCGTPNQPGDRFCSSCGAGLKQNQAPREQISPRQWLDHIIGTTRKARLTSATTAVALVVAVIAFVALKPSEDAIPRDAYTIAADHLCLGAKKKIVAAERRAGRGNTSLFAQELVQIVAGWRSQFAKLHVPDDRIETAQSLEAALLEAEVQIARFGRTAQTGNQNEVVESAKQADTASAGVEEAIAALGLSRCAAATIGFSASSG